MTKKIMGISVMVLGLGVLGCDSLVGVLGAVLQSNTATTTVTIAFVNTSPDFGIEVDFYSSETDDLPRDLLTNPDISDAERLSFTLDADDTFSFNRRCDAVQSLVIDDADLLVLGGLGPEDNTSVLYDGDDFRCGDTITFTFTSDSVTDLRITTSVEAPTPDSGT